MNMQDERFWTLVSLKLNDEAGPEELAELEKLLILHPERGMQVQVLQSLWKSAAPAAGRQSFDRHMQRLSNHLSEPVLQFEDEAVEAEPAVTTSPVRKIVYWISGIAACFLLGFLIFLNKPEATRNGAVAKNAVTTKRGSKSNIELPDGTQVWLNSDSKITYNERFQGEVREVSLSGEAFFDVVRDESRPFIIHTNTLDIRVLGTSFNVRSYENEKVTETSLIQGSLEVTLRCRPDKKIILKPSEKLIVQNDEAKKTESAAKSGSSKQLLTLAHVNFEKKDSSVIETLWVKNKLAFDGEAFEDIALKIERWFDVKVVINDEELKTTPFSAVFDGESLQEVLEALRISGDFRYTIDRKVVNIYP